MNLLTGFSVLFCSIVMIESILLTVLVEKKLFIPSIISFVIAILCLCYLEFLYRILV